MCCKLIKKRTVWVFVILTVVIELKVALDTPIRNYFFIAANLKLIADDSIEKYLGYMRIYEDESSFNS